MAYISFKGRELIEDRHLSLPTPDLVPQMEKSFPTGAVRTDDNMVIHGDNLLALKALVPLYANKIKCIYIDPPYNTGNEHWVFNDNASSFSAIDLGIDISTGTEDLQLDQHDAWLCMMMPRLKLLHELLADDGVILISIDDNEHARLKLLLDDIFHEQNFIANLVWNSPGVRDVKRATDVSNEHEYILVYAKDISAKGVFTHSDPVVYLAPDTQSRPIQYGWPFNTGRPTVIGDGIYTEDGLRDCKAIFGERAFDYPKPVALIKSLMSEFTRPDSIVLDSFAGTGTTGQAILELNANDSGHRRAILIEKQDYADTITAERMRRVITGDRPASGEPAEATGGSFCYFEISK